MLTVVSRRAQGKKKQFIDRSADSTAHFHVVHRSQRDPKAADADAPQRVLAPAEIGQRKGASERGSQSTRAWLEEQDLGGFDEASEVPPPTTQQREDYADLGFGQDGYDYGQHLREIKEDGVFIPRADLVAPRGPGSVASQALSSASRASRLSRASVLLRGTSGVEDVFESAEEVDHGMGGALNGMNVLSREEEEAKAKEEMDPDLWAALHEDETILEGEEGEEGEEDPGEIDDDFVLQADRPTEFVENRMIRKKNRAARTAGGAAVDGSDGDDEDGGEEGEEEGEEVLESTAAGGGGGVGGASGAEVEGAAAKKKINPFKELFPSDSEGEEEVETSQVKSSPVKKKINPFKELFPSDSEGEEEEGDGDKADGGLSRGIMGVRVSGRGGRGRPVEEDSESVTGGGGGSGGGRLLDERFEKLLEREYSDEEIGELEEDDPRVVGADDLGDFEGILDDYLASAKKLSLAEYMDGENVSSRAYARLPPAHTLTKEVAAKSEVDKFGNGGDEEDEYSSDGSLDDHPFFDGLKEVHKPKEWDAETILSTYTTTENHPTAVKLARRPRKAAETIALDPKTGLPVGTMLPAEEERHRTALAAGEGREEEEEEEEERFNLGEARPKGESAAARKDRKAAAREMKAVRRAEKKETKVIFKVERVNQAQVAKKTAQPAGVQSLSSWAP